MRKLLLLIPVIIIIGCGLFGTKDFFPLKVGNKWIFEGHMYSATDSAAIKSEQEITGTDAIGGKDVFVFIQKVVSYVFFPINDTFEFVDTSFIKEDKDTIWSYATKTDSTPMIVAILPLEADKSWTQIFGSDTIKSTVKAQEDITVPAGTFKSCWKIETKNNGVLANTSWYANGKGQVKAIAEGYLLELKEATIK